MEVEVDVLGSPSLIILIVSVDVKQHSTKGTDFRVKELCGSRGGRPGLPVPNKPSVSVDVKQHFNKNAA